jgi:hypothetical protein
MNLNYDNYIVDGFIEPDEIDAMDYLKKEDLSSYVFKRINMYDKIWSITDGKKDLIIPSLNRKQVACPIFPSNGLAKAYRQAIITHPSNRPKGSFIADLYPRSYSINEFTGDIIKVLNNNKKSEIKLVIQTYTNAIELTTEEFLSKLKQYK